MEWETKIDDIENFRNRYYHENPGSSEKSREEAVRRKIDGFLEELHAANLTKPRLNYLSGKVLNLLDDYCAKSEEFLTRAVKLDPQSTDVINELGECLWKKPDMKAAKNCFESSLQKKRNKVALRNLATIRRQESAQSNAAGASVDFKKRQEIVEEALTLAQEAVDLDPADGYSCYTLANGYLTAFFDLCQRKSDYIRLAIETFGKALQDERQLYNTELFLNRGTALRYEESYLLALECFEKATKLDPFFETASVNLTNLISFLTRTVDSISKKGRVKAKRLNEMLNSFCRQTDLGPYSNGVYRSVTGASLELNYKPLSELQPGKNEFSVTLVKVVGVIINDDVMPYSFCCMGEDGSCVAATVYNFSERFGVTIGQTMAIPEPFVADVNFRFRDQDYSFRTIRIATPEVLVVNRKKLTKDTCALALVSLSA